MFITKIRIHAEICQQQAVGTPQSELKETVKLSHRHSGRETESERHLQRLQSNKSLRKKRSEICIARNPWATTPAHAFHFSLLEDCMYIGLSWTRAAAASSKPPQASYRRNRRMAFTGTSTRAPRHPHTACCSWACRSLLPTSSIQGRSLRFVAMCG